ncbi:hypothetical protein [Flammeovirga sp. EKP202]|uniref:hypothetical protein n=1 Tax=Flammeovirga sp. EKP202 TaxID=2770592 RepID=UPI00165F05EC|nr:hypothetical protein [Flammeovirga sp. EKP202]MBD0399987.1 hypothetical protein [Flammeovirga sp. EKP202]
MDKSLKFRGKQNRIIDSDEIISSLKDYLDVALLNKSLEVKELNEPDKIFSNSEEFWIAAMENDLYAGQIIKLPNYKLLEWVPSSPGLFHTRQAKQKREFAMSSNRRWRERKREDEEMIRFPTRHVKNKKVIELRPSEKRSMIQGGFGSLRVAPKTINNDLFYILCATSSGVSHEGITTSLRKEHYAKVVEELRKGKVPEVDITARLMILPEEFSPIKNNYQHYRTIPKYYLEVLELGVADFKSPANAVVSVAITYAKKDEFIRNNSFSYSFCSFNPTNNNSELRGAVSWLHDYAERYSEEKNPIILGDFDEEFNHFGDVEFPIKQIANGKIPLDKLHYFKEIFHYQINELIMGDKNVFKNSQIGAVGSNAISTNNSFQQMNYNIPEDLDFNKLHGQLGQLRENLAMKAKSPEEFKAIGEVAEAELASKDKDGNKVVKHLKGAGKWVFDTAKDVGMDLVTELIKKQMEL